ncbi:mechanosensitive ion channel-like protein [Chitinophaga dinghuensis]|uniref:Mechanosensitive ion channel-like protein n=1 Tax=Chitinophaga dinghuensis TaxID=1539050 RepID=A0A327WDL1_9BACT|nr:mechanosensitive ion channel family protein [Chitinophaga dinghuensis]RAJ85466.1 mechanosensitive ion channel-like protein [Chitinophaga dinghuensis]
MRLLCSVLTFLLWITTTSNILAQQDSSRTAKPTAADSQLVITTSVLRETDSLMKADSMEKRALMEEITALKAGNDARRQELMKRLSAIEQADSLKKVLQIQRIQQLKAISTGIPVKPFEDTLFYVYNKIGPLLPSERAANIEQKIQRLGDDPLFVVDSIKMVPNENNLDVTYGEMILFTITNDDALWLEQDKTQVAKHYISLIDTAIAKYKDENSWKSLFIRVALLLLILAVFAAIVYIINRLFRRIRLRILQKKERYFQGMKVKGYSVLNPEKQLRVTFNILRVVRIVVILVVLYITLPAVFSIFPWTKGIADALITWTLSPLKAMIMGVVAYLPKLLTILVIYIMTRYLVKLVNYLSREVATGNLVIRGFYADWAQPTASGIKFLLYAFMFVVIFPYLPGSDSKIFQGVSVFLGILFSLGSSSAISNIIAGFVITYMRPFKIGDKIKLGDISGEVIEKTLLVTRLRTVHNEEITVPNASILNGHTINYSTSSLELGLILHTTVTIGYDVPWPKVHELLIAAARQTAGISGDRQPFVLQTSLDDFAVAYEINAYTNHPESMGQIYSDLHQHIQDEFNKAGVEIMSPHYYAHRDGNRSTIPSDHLPKDYEAPSFGIKMKGKE